MPVASAYRLARRSMIARTNAASGTTYAKASRRSGFLTYIVPTKQIRCLPLGERKTASPVFLALSRCVGCQNRRGT